MKSNCDIKMCALPDELILVDLFGTFYTHILRYFRINSSYISKKKPWKSFAQWMKNLFKEKKVCFVIDGYKSREKEVAHQKRSEARAKDVEKLTLLLDKWNKSDKRVSKSERKKFDGLERRLQTITMDTKRQIFDAMISEGLFVNCD